HLQEHLPVERDTQPRVPGGDVQCFQSDDFWRARSRREYAGHVREDFFPGEYAARHSTRPEAELLDDRTQRWTPALHWRPLCCPQDNAAFLFGASRRSNLRYSDAAHLSNG